MTATGPSNLRHHITVEADRATGEWRPGTIQYAGTVDVLEYMEQPDTETVFHTMHYLTRKIRAELPSDAKIDADGEIDIAVTITKK